MTQVATQPQEQDEAHAEPIVIIRPSFKKICDGEPCRAALFNHILYWIARKRKSGIDYWYSTGDGLYHDLAESWGVTQVRREVKALINSNLVGVLKNPRMAIDRTKHFFFQSAQAAVFFAKCAAEKICFACIGLCKEVIDLLNAHLIDLLNAPTKDEAIDKSVKCLCAQHQEHLMELSKPFDKSITPITQVSYSESVSSSESISESNITFTVVNGDELRPYIDGYVGSFTLPELECDAEDFSTPVIHTVDTMSHSHVVQATGNEGEDDGTDTQHSRDNSAGRLRTGTLLPISGGSGLHHDSHPEGYQESAQRRGRLEAAPPQEQPHALQVGATSPPARETRKRGVGKKAPDAIDITVEGMEVYRAWCSLFKVTVPLNKAIAKAANELVEPLAVWAAVKGCTHKEVLKLIKNWLYENDKNGYYSRGVKLYDIAREFEGWQSKQEQPPSTNGTHATKNEGVRLIGGKPSSELTEAEIEALPTPFLRKAARSARASC